MQFSEVALPDKRVDIAVCGVLSIFSVGRADEL
jgi:hypothetical protein